MKSVNSPVEIYIPCSSLLLSSVNPNMSFSSPVITQFQDVVLYNSIQSIVACQLWNFLYDYCAFLPFLFNLNSFKPWLLAFLSVIFITYLAFSYVVLLSIYVVILSVCGKMNTTAIGKKRCLLPEVIVLRLYTGHSRLEVPSCQQGEDWPNWHVAHVAVVRWQENVFRSSAQHKRCKENRCGHTSSSSREGLKGCTPSPADHRVLYKYKSQRLRMGVQEEAVYRRKIRTACIYLFVCLFIFCISF